VDSIITVLEVSPEVAADIRATVETAYDDSVVVTQVGGMNERCSMFMGNHYTAGAAVWAIVILSTATHQTELCNAWSKKTTIWLRISQ
jgi:hypothetical protein